MTPFARPRFRLLALLLLGCLLAVPACSSGRKKCYPVSGELYVDGKPAPDVFVYLHSVDQTDLHLLYGQTAEDGTFRIATYVSADGAPAGEYIVTFEWPERSGLLKQNFDGPDRLKKRYFEKDKSNYRVTVKKEPLVIPRFDLTTK